MEVLFFTNKLKAERLVLDWRKHQQTRAAVRLDIEMILDKLPEEYTQEKYISKCDLVYEHIYVSYYGEDKSIYPIAE